MDLFYVTSVEEEWLVPCWKTVETGGAEHLEEWAAWAQLRRGRLWGKS